MKTRISSGAVLTSRYGLDGSGIECRLEVRFSAPILTGPEAHPASYTMSTMSFPGVKWPGRGVNHQPQLAPKTVALYLYFPSGPLWHVLR